MNDTKVNRRHFLQTSALFAGAALLSPGGLRAAAAPAKRTAVDQVTLGKTGIHLSRLGVGTGSNNGEVQRALGHEGFNKLIRYAYDSGITYIDTAQNYQTHDWVREAIKGLPREKLFIQTKMPRDPEDPKAVLDRYRKELDTDYIDSLLIHCAESHTWADDKKKMMDVFEEAKANKIIRAHGISCHGLPALTRATLIDWVDVHLVRINHNGTKMDNAENDWNKHGNPQDAMAEVKQMRAKGRGIIGMKLIGNGEFTSAEEREKSIRFVMQSGLVDAVVIGVKSKEEIDEAIERINRALAEA